MLLRLQIAIDPWAGSSFTVGSACIKDHYVNFEIKPSLNGEYSNTQKGILRDLVNPIIANFLREDVASYEMANPVVRVKADIVSAEHGRLTYDPFVEEDYRFNEVVTERYFNFCKAMGELDKEFGVEATKDAIFFILELTKDAPISPATWRNKAEKIRELLEKTVKV